MPGIAGSFSSVIPALPENGVINANINPIVSLGHLTVAELQQDFSWVTGQNLPSDALLLPVCARGERVELTKRRHSHKLQNSFPGALLHFQLACHVPVGASNDMFVWRIRMEVLHGQRERFYS